MFDWWNRIESVAALNNWMLMAVMVCASLAALVVVLSKNKIRKMDKALSNSDQRVLSIEETAESIRKEMLKSKQDNDIAQLRLQSLESENNKLKQMLERAKMEQMETTSSLEEIKKQQEISFRNTLETLDPPPDMGLTGEQHEQLIDILENGPKGNIEIFSVIGNEASQVLANEISKTLNSDGWTVGGVVQSAFSQTPDGLVFAVNSKDTAPSYSSFLQRAFTTIGIPVSVKINKKYREWSLTIIVGQLPKK